MLQQLLSELNLTIQFGEPITRHLHITDMSSIATLLKELHRSLVICTHHSLHVLGFGVPTILIIEKVELLPVINNFMSTKCQWGHGSQAQREGNGVGGWMDGWMDLLLAAEKPFR